MSTQKPPQTNGAPLVGNLVDLLQRPFEFREEITQNYDGIVRVPAGPMELYLVTEPAYIEEVFVSKADSFQKPELMRERLGAAFGDGLLLSGGELWADQRELIQPAFYPDRISEYVEQMGRLTQGVIDDWEAGAYDMKASMEQITVPALVECLFTTDDVSYVDRISEGAEALTMKYKPTSPSFYLPDWVPTPTNREYHQGLEMLDGVVDNILQERSNGSTHDDLLSILLEAANDDDSYVDRKLIRDEMLTMMTGGSGPPAFALAYALYLLAQHPEEYEKLQQEADRVLDGELPTMSELPSLTRTEQAYKEALRLYPPVWTMGREPTEDVTVGGYHIPEGAAVNVTAWTVQRDPQWFDAPETFDPARWSTDRDRPTYAYFPFGGGPRVCVGKRFATAEAKIVLSLIASQYDLEPVSDEPLEHLISTHMSPKNATVRVSPR